MVKAAVTLGGVALAGVSPVVWMFQTGTEPYTTVFSVHKTTWDKKLKHKVGSPLDLSVVDSRNARITIKEVYILHEAPSDSPYRVAFVVADKRWKWPYTLIARDYNMTRRSGDRFVKKDAAANITGRITIDSITYKQYSLRDGKNKWTARDAVEDVLALVEGENGYTIDSFPIKGTSGESGSFSLQNIMLRDPADVAISRLLSYIPAASITVDQNGKVRVFDAADFKAAESHAKELSKKTTYDGDRLQLIDRSKIRPARVAVHYQREVEAVFEFEDEYQTTVTVPDKNDPFLENVVPTVDPVTKLGKIRDAEGNQVDNEVPAGTWGEFNTWLEAMDETKPEASAPWTFKTLSQHWIGGELDAVLGALPGKPTDVVKDEEGGQEAQPINAVLRYQALRRNFRQTFRINPRYMDRIRDIRATLVGTRDPISGARGPALIWGQAAARLSLKGILTRKDKEKGSIWAQYDNLPQGNKNLRATAASPAKATFEDRDLGIFRVEWLLSPYATELFFVPFNTVTGESKNIVGPTRDLSQQSKAPIGTAMKMKGKDTIWIGMSPTMEMKVLMTIFPAAPNNKSQFFAETLEASDISEVFRSAYRIQEGKGPTLEVFVPPTEATARFQWQKDKPARELVKRLLGLDSDNPNEAGIDPGDNMEGGGAFVFSNYQNEIRSHSRAVAAEALAAFADNIQGRGATTLPTDGLKLVGNMSSVTLQVGADPSAKVSVLHDFPGQAQPISHFAMMSEGARKGILGIIEFGSER